MTETRSSRRVFFALWPDAAALDQLEALGRRAVECCGGRPMRRDSLHMTLEFVGAVTPLQLEQLYALGQGLPEAPFAVELDCCGYWPHNRIFWAGCQATPSPLRRLSDFLRANLAEAGFKLESRAFAPHVTLVRNARCEARLDELPLKLPQSIGWQAGAVALVESFMQPSGARYRTLRQWPLTDSA